MKIKEFITNSVAETQNIAANLANVLDAGDVLTLEGELGTGKTAFTKGLAKGLGITRNVNSPTFTLIKEYHGRLPLYHMDVYRLEDAAEDIGFSEYFNGHGVSVVEWAQYIEEYLPEQRLEIVIHYIDEHTRRLEITAFGDHYINILEEIEN